MTKVTSGLILFTAYLFATIPAGAQEKPTPISLTTDPTTISATYRDSTKPGKIRVVAVRGAPSTILLRSRPAKLGDNYAPITFEANAKDWLNLDLHAPSSILVPIVVSNLMASGSYEGAVEALSLDTGALLATTKILVLRADAAFGPVVSGDLLKNGQLEFNGTKGDQFVLVIQNPAQSIERSLVLSVLPATQSGVTPTASKKATVPTLLDFTPPTVRLRPGQGQHVFATLRKAIPSGTTYRALRIAAEDDPTEPLSALAGARIVAPSGKSPVPN
jgi:hypothetical protein